LPWKRLSKLTKALRPGSLTVLAGPAGHGKSFFLLQIAAHVHSLGHDFSYLILEDQKIDFERRILAHLSGTWQVIDDDQESAETRLKILSRYENEVNNLAEHVPENPRLAITGKGGNIFVPPLPFSKVLDWVAREMKTSRVVIIDPLTQIDFSGNKSWKEEADFIRHLTGLASLMESSVILATHTVKRSGKNNTLPLTGEDIQGSADIKRLSHTVLLLDVHDKNESEVWREEGRVDTVFHNRTVIVDKVRNAPGKGNRVAFSMDSPVFEELGVIAPKEKKHNSNSLGNGIPSDRAYKD